MFQTTCDILFSTTFDVPRRWRRRLFMNISGWKSLFVSTGCVPKFVEITRIWKSNFLENRTMPHHHFLLRRSSTCGQNGGVGELFCKYCVWLLHLRKCTLLFAKRHGASFSRSKVSDDQRIKQLSNILPFILLETSTYWLYNFLTIRLSVPPYLAR